MELTDSDNFDYALMVVLRIFSGEFNSGLVFGVLLVIILFLLSAMVSAAETAFFSLKTNQLKDLRTNDSTEDDMVARLLQNPKKLLATIVISNNFVNISIILISTYLISAFFDVQAHPVLVFILQLIVLTFLLFFFGEVLPKVYATHQPMKVALFMAKPIFLLQRLWNPVSTVLINSTNFVDKSIARKGMNISLSELEEAIDITTNEDTPADEKKILRGIVSFSEIDVKEIMKPRVHITALENILTYDEMLMRVLDAGYSRIPVFEDNLDKVIGVLYIKDLLPLIGSKENFNWLNLIRPAFFIPENKKISDLLEEFQKKKIHLAVVVDEYGGTSGIITLEDIIEEIVGEINDEFDLESENLNYSKLDDHNYIFPGEAPLTDVCRLIDIDDESFDEVKGDSGTLAGLILEIVGKIPEQNEKIAFSRFLFRIEAADKRKIKKVKITLSDASID